MRTVLASISSTRAIGHAELDDLDGGAAPPRRCWGTSRSPPRSPRAAGRAHRDLGDHAQRALAADHQARQVVAGAGLLGARAGADDLAAGRDHFQRQHVFAHGAVAHGVGAAGARGAHAADRGVGAGVDREEQAGGFDLVVELLARHAGLHRHRQVFGVDAQHPVHAAHVDADAALHRQQVAFERRAHTEGDHRHLVLTGQLHGIGHVLRAFGKHHGGRWRHGGEGRFVAPVLLAHGQRGGAALAEAGLQGVDQRGGYRA
jgi:hypothetical protein